ncbi:MAG: hypothetical protein ACRCY3_10595 [Sphingorhabdus sp.]
MYRKSLLSAALMCLLGSAPLSALTTEAIVPVHGAKNQIERRIALQQRKSQPAANLTQPQQAQLAMPSADTMLIMIRSSLLALSQANQTNNYAVLNALGSESFRTGNSPQRLAESFAAFRINNVDLAPVALIDPQLSAQPTMIAGRLRLVGFFPSQPMRVGFDLTYDPTPAGWKIQAIAVNLSPAQPAPQAQKAPPATR